MENEELLVRYVQLRQTQLFAATALTDVQGEHLKSMISVFGPELVTTMTLGARSGWRSLRCSTEASGEFATERLVGLLTTVFGAHGKFGKLAAALANHFEHGPMRVTVEENADLMDPRVEFGWTGRHDIGAIEKLLGDIRLNPDFVAVYEDLSRTLYAEAVNEFRVVFDDMQNGPRFEIDFDRRFIVEDRETFQTQVRAACETLGVWEAHRNYLSGTVEGLAPRPVNNVPITIAMDFEKIIPELRLTYFEIPARFAIKLFTQFDDSDTSAGRNLGVMSAAVGLEDEVVNELALTGKSTPQQPGLCVSVRTDALPGVGDA